MYQEIRHRRPETLETGLESGDLLQSWQMELPRMARRLQAAMGIDDLVNVIRPCTLRAKISALRRGVDPGFNEFALRWNGLKYKALLRAVSLRATVPGIKVGYFLDYNQPSRYQERLVFVFNTQPKPYRTETALSNLATLMQREELMALLEPFDDFDPHKGEKKIFNAV